tara:strand:+ start:6191 stop:6934 length:744 start_codon:yes stop_codon:yes gene_type:complete
MPLIRGGEEKEEDYTFYENYIPNYKNYIPNYKNYTDDINLNSFDNLFDTKYFVFWAIIIIIIVALVVKNVSYLAPITDLGMNIGITSIFVIALITLCIFTNSGRHIKNNILVIKTKLKDNNLEQILFKKDNKNNKLNLITIKNDDNESFDKNSVKKFFDEQFSQSLDDLHHDISDYYIYNRESHVYYINVKINKALLSGEERDKKNYRFIPINELKDYNINKNDYNEHKYNENVLPILFKLNDDFFE